MTWSRRSLIIGLGSSFMGVGSARSQTSPPRTDDAAWKFLDSLPPEKRSSVLEQEAAREGGAVVYGALGIDRAQLFIKPFEAKYPHLNVQFVRLSESGLVDKMLLEARTGRIGSDLSIASIPWLDLLRPTLGAYEPASWSEFDPRLKLGGMKQGWTALAYEILPSAIAWRTDRVKPADAPRTLDAVMQPKWKDRVGTTTQLEAMLQGLVLAFGEKKAMSMAEKLGALHNRLYTSIAALSDALAQGEIDVAWNMGAHRPALLKKKGAPVDYVLEQPIFGQGITMSVTKGAHNPYTAALFMEFATSAAVLQQVDKAEPGRFFGNMSGHYAQTLSNSQKLVLFPPLSSNRFRQLKQITDRLFVRQTR